MIDRIATARAADPKSRLNKMGTLEDQPDQDADVLGIAAATLIIETDIIKIGIIESAPSKTTCRSPHAPRRA